MDSILAYAAQPRGPESLSNKKDAEAKDLELKEACKEFEAVLTSIVLKEGLKSSQQFLSEEDTDRGSQTFMEVANEQMARFIGKQGMMGFGDSIYNSLKDRENL